MDDKLKNKIFDDMLEYAVKEEFETVLKNMTKDEELEEYIPSKEFDLKMKNTIKRYARKQMVNKIVNVSKKVAVWGAVITTISLGALLSVEASRQYILNMFIKFGKGNAVISGIGEDRQTKPDRRLKPEYIPNGYQEREVVEIGLGISITYENDDGDVIDYYYTPLTQSSLISIDTDGTGYTTVDINGMTLIYLKGKMNIISLY